MDVYFLWVLLQEHILFYLYRQRNKRYQFGRTQVIGTVFRVFVDFFAFIVKFLSVIRVLSKRNITVGEKEHVLDR